MFLQPLSQRINDYTNCRCRVNKGCYFEIINYHTYDVIFHVGNGDEKFISRDFRDCETGTLPKARRISSRISRYTSRTRFTCSRRELKSGWSKQSLYMDMVATPFTLGSLSNLVSIIWFRCTASLTRVWEIFHRVVHFDTLEIENVLCNPYIRLPNLPSSVIYVPTSSHNLCTSST